MKKFLIVDGSSLIHRAFYALPLLTNGAGAFTNAAYGFTNMFMKILGEENPGYCVVCFDKSRVTFRTEQYHEYKAQRKATPEELKPQFDLVKQILTAMNIAWEELDGFEADDLIGTFACQGEKQGLENLILTGDKDALQLISPQCTVLLIRKGISEMDRYDEKAVMKRYGLVPNQIIDLKGLMGDQSDNIPGVPGIGEKTALKLLTRFESIESILANLDEVTPPGVQKKLREHRDLAVLSQKLATIECDVPIEIDVEFLKVGKPDYGKLLEIYKELEFKSLVKNVLERMSERQNKTGETVESLNKTVDYRRLESREEISSCLNEIIPQGKVALYVTHRGNYFAGEPASVSFAVSGDKAWTVFLDEEDEQEKLSALAELLENDNVKKIVYNYKDLSVLFSRAGIRLTGVISDVLLGAYLLNPSTSDYSLETLSLEFLNRPLVSEEEEVADRSRRAALIWELAPFIQGRIAEQEMDDLYRQVELPLEDVLAGMEITGVKVDSSQLKVMSGEMEGAIENLSKEIYQLAGEEFNINSPKQLGVILFDKLGLPPIKKTKTGYSTNAEVLERLAEQHEIAAKIVEHRTLVKLKSTYVDGMQSLINPETGKIHTSFNQTVTATGRLSSTEPNLQNIPIRMELGRQIRKAFGPSQKGNILLAGDYSQIELRVLAHISGDPVLQEAFREDQDIHARTASEVFGVPMEEVVPEMRRRAKAVNFGIVYGISDYGLSRDLGITRKEAKKYINNYFARYQGVAEYMHRVIKEARDKGYVITLLNRRRYLPDIYSPNFNIRSFGERTAMNTPIQGSAADIIKIAMVKIHQAFREAGFRSKMILQVHDELIFDVVPEEIEIVSKTVKELMENAISLNVPLKVDLKSGIDWYSMKRI